MKEVQKDVQVFVSNLLPKGVRHDTLEGRDFIVAPVVMLTEGVHAGSAGPILYTKEELAKVPAVWDHKPVVVYHPNGSACQPEVLSSRKVGLILRTKFDRGRLKAEAWLDPTRVELVDSRVKEAVETGKVMEVATGLFADLEPEEGEWKGEKYVAIARNIRPDHLAILPDMVGACSVADGAGLLRNVNMRDQVIKRIQDVLRQETSAVLNEVSHGEIFASLSKAVADRFARPVKPGLMDTSPGPFLVDVFEDYVVFEQGGKFWKLGYTLRDAKVELSQDEPEEAVRTVQYRPVSNTVTKKEIDGDHPASHYLVVEDPEKPSTWHLRVKDVDGNPDHRLMGAAWAALHEGYRGNKYEGPDKQEALRKLKALYREEDMELPTENMRSDNMENDKKQETPAPVKNADQEPGKGEKQADPVVKNAEIPPKPLTAEDYIAQAPPEIREVLQNGLQTYKDQKAAVIANLLAVKGNPFSKEELEQKPLIELRRLETLAAAAVPKPVFTGQAEVANSAKTEEPLPVPVLNFERKEK